MKKQILCTLLVMVMAISLAACGKKIENDSEEPYKITLLLRAFADDETSADVEAAINQQALKDLNMSVDIIFVSFGNAANQIQLMLSSGEDLDVTYLPGGNIPSYVDAGYLVNIADYDISGLTKALGEEIISACRSADHSLYTIPTFKEHAGQGAIVLRKDICDELGIDISGIHGMDDLTDIYAKVKEAYPSMSMLGNDLTGVFNAKFDSLGGDWLGGLDNAPESTEVVNVYDTDTFKDMCTLMYQWNQAGYVRADLSTSEESKETVFAAGNCFSYIDAYKPDSVAEKEAQSGFEVYVVPLTDALMTGYNTTVTGYGIAQNSKDKEKAAKFLNWMYTSSEFNNLINWGIEGTDYQVIDKTNGVIDYVDGQDGSSVNYHQALGWNYPNQSIAYVWNGTNPDVWEEYKAWEANAKRSAALGCTFDLSTVVDDVASCNTVISKYKTALLCGEVNPEEVISQMNEELETAGLQNIIKHKQEILDNWLKN